MANYHIYIRSEEHPRNINTPRNARTYFTCFECATKEEVVAKFLELQAQGITPYEMRTPASSFCKIRYTENGVPYVYIIPSRGIPFCR
jgi:hypothetical protein